MKTNKRNNHLTLPPDGSASRNFFGRLEKEAEDEFNKKYKPIIDTLNKSIKGGEELLWHGEKIHFFEPYKASLNGLTFPKGGEKPRFAMLSMGAIEKYYHSVIGNQEIAIPSSLSEKKDHFSSLSDLPMSDNSFKK